MYNYQISTIANRGDISIEIIKTFEAMSFRSAKIQAKKSINKLGYFGTIKYKLLAKINPGYYETSPF